MTFKFYKDETNTDIYFSQTLSDIRSDSDWSVDEMTLEYEWRVEKMKFGVFLAPTITKLEIKLIESIEGIYRYVTCTDWDIENINHIDSTGSSNWLSLEYEPMHIDCDEETKSVTLEWRT